MAARKVYIKSASQISCQKPLSEEWMDSPVALSGEYLRSADPVFSDFIPPMQARRMGLLLKRAVVTSMDALSKSGISSPDAVITGTALGCMENTERFLGKICREGEEMLSPTDFMQSTHNTISSLIAIRTGNKGYNCTYSHGESSFGSALMDAMVQIRLGKISSALVGCHDETTPETFTVLSRAGYFSPMQNPATEISMSMVLSEDCGSALCELFSVKVIASSEDDDAIALEALSGTGYSLSDAMVITDRVSGPVFGRNLSLPAAEIYSAAHYVGEGRTPCAVVIGGSCGDERTVAVLVRIKP